MARADLPTPVALMVPLLKTCRSPLPEISRNRRTAVPTEVMLPSLARTRRAFAEVSLMALPVELVLLIVPKLSISGAGKSLDAGLPTTIDAAVATVREPPALTVSVSWELIVRAVVRELPPAIVVSVTREFLHLSDKPTSEGTANVLPVACV